MDVVGERVLIVGDSLTHHGFDDASEIWDVDVGSDRASSTPGDLLASMLLEQGAQAVRTDANVGRSAHNFWAGTARHQHHSAADLIASDQAWGPTKVVVMLGTNDADSGAIDANAMTAIRDTYAGMGAEVWAVGPPIFVSDALNAKADQVYTMMSDIFGARLIDARPLSTTVGRAGDGVHFQPIAAQQFALQLENALLTTQGKKPWLGVALGAVVFGTLGYALWRHYRSGLDGITVEPAGLKTLKIDVTDIEDHEVDALDDAIDEVGQVTSQSGNFVYVRVDESTAQRALDRFMRYAESKGIMVREGADLNGPSQPSHYQKQKQPPEKIPAYFVDSETGDVVEVDQRTAKYRREGETEFRGSMLQTIAAESRTAEEYARRAEAWASTEAKPPSITTMAKAYRRAKPWTLAKLIREAREARQGSSRHRFESLISQHEGDDLDGTVKPTWNTPTEPGYLYHATNTERAHDIIKGGVRTHGPSYGTDQDTWPDGSTEKRSYWSRKAGVVHSFAPEEGEPVIIRIKESEIDAHTERGTGDVFVLTTVPSKKIEILTDDGWQPLRAESLDGLLSG